MNEFIEDIEACINQFLTYLWDNDYQFYLKWWYAIDQIIIFSNNQINGCLEQGSDT